MRFLAVLFGLFALTAAAPQPRAARDWSTVAIKKPDGAYLIGNPRARVKLIEYASYTCPHCAEFANQSALVLKDRMIRSGDVSLEFRHVVFNALDLGAVVLARCTGPRGFATTTARLYATQGKWLPRGAAWGQANAQRLAGQPPARQLRALIDGAGLTPLATGLTSAQIDACLTDIAEINRITAMQGQIDGTPTFFLNGQRVAPNDWAQLQPLLRAAGAR